MKYFRFGLRGTKDAAIALLDEYPMPARNKEVRRAQVRAVNVILSNANGGELTIRYFQNIKASEYGFSRIVFKAALEHLHELKRIDWKGNGTSRSVIIYREGITVPGNRVYTPPITIAASIKDRQSNRKRSVRVKLNTKAKKLLDKRIRTYWVFLKHHDIQHNIDQDVFDIYTEYRKIKDGKAKTPGFPNKHNICPVAVYNDRSVSIGGRFYRAFWISMPSVLRRLITIDGEKTADIDGKSMHVQLLYRKAGLPVPKGELYIYPKIDKRRKITKKLMMYMMNTRKDWDGDSGRVAVIKTYKKHKTVYEDLMPYILELEKLHQPIKHLLYKSNWGELQGTEAGIMLRIMESAMRENILILPVHDGCLCQRKHRDRVLELFKDQGIEAEENKDHLRSVDVKEMRRRIREIEELKSLKI